MKQNYRMFGVWRLLAACLVMAYHFSHYIVNREPVLDWFEHMLPLLDMFFIMSGFLIFEHYGQMENTGRNQVKFLIKRLARLYPLHIVTLSIFVAFAILVHAGLIHSDGADSRYALSALPANLLLVQAWGFDHELTFNYVSWSLSGEWFAYLIFPIVLFAFKRGRTAGLALLLILCVGALEFAFRGASKQYDYWFDTKLWAAYRVAADFVYGALLCNISRKLTIPAYCQWKAWIALAITFVAMFADADIYVVLGLFGLAITFAALADKTETDDTAWMNPIMPLAAVSFGVYLWHPVVELFAYSLIWKRIIGIDSATLFWLYLPLPMIMTMIVAIFSARYLERPLGKWIETGLGSLMLRISPEAEDENRQKARKRPSPSSKPGPQQA